MQFNSNNKIKLLIKNINSKIVILAVIKSIAHLNLNNYYKWSFYIIITNDIKGYINAFYSDRIIL
jgi:hypothetical protein